jgi:hypothetical protein
MICRFTRLEGVEHTRFVHSQTNSILRSLFFLAGTTTGILVHPHILLLEALRLLLLLLRLLVVLISWMLATAGAPLLLFYGRHLGQTISIVLPVISPLVPVIRAIELPGSTGIAIVPLILPLSL